MTSVAEITAAAEGGRIGDSAGDIARDIARGGLAGLVAGVVVGGFGGRLVMRLATLLVPDSAGRLTDNGNQIGTITLDGTLALLIFGGLFGGIAAGIVWVTVSPWIPGAGIRRAVLTMPIAVALSGFFLVQGDNPDFLVLRNDARVVAMLLGLIALLGFAISSLDELLDRRLPRVSTGRPVATVVYTVLIAVGLLFLPYIVGRYFESPSTPPLAMTLVAIGAATVVWWGLRLRGRRTPPRNLLLAGRTALLAAVVFGVIALVPEVAGALEVR